MSRRTSPRDTENNFATPRVNARDYRRDYGHNEGARCLTGPSGDDGLRPIRNTNHATEILLVIHTADLTQHALALFKLLLDQEIDGSTLRDTENGSATPKTEARHRATGIR